LFGWVKEQLTIRSGASIFVHKVVTLLLGLSIVTLMLKTSPTDNHTFGITGTSLQREHLKYGSSTNETFSYAEWLQFASTVRDSVNTCNRI
jgi:hypothetical protein